MSKLKDHWIGTYLQGTGGPSLLQKSSFERNDVTFANKVDYNLSGEVGVLFAFERAVVKVGLEAVRPQVVQGGQATGAGEVTLYSVTSGIISYGPTVGLDLQLGNFENFRFYILASAGYMKTTLKNDYQFTTPGQTQYSLIDYTEEGSAYSIMGRGGVGLEFPFSDAVTMSLEVGYRSLVASGLVHERGATTFSGAVTAGQTMKNRNGVDRVVDLSGGWAGVGLRFYFE